MSERGGEGVIVRGSDSERGERMRESVRGE